LQVVENWNSANEVVFYGKDGKLTGPDRETVEVSMLALHLLQSSLVYIQLRHTHATKLNNGISIEADAVLGLTAHAPEPFDARHHWSGSSRSTWSTSLSALGALEEVERSRRDTVVLSDR